MFRNPKFGNINTFKEPKNKEIIKKAGVFIEEVYSQESEGEKSDSDNQDFNTVKTLFSKKNSSESPLKKNANCRHNFLVQDTNKHHVQTRNFLQEKYGDQKGLILSLIAVFTLITISWAISYVGLRTFSSKDGTS